MELKCPVCPEAICVREDARIWCTGCGTELGKSPIYLRGYATPMHYVRRQAYSRVKRFRKYLVHVIRYCKVSDALWQNFDIVLDLYSAFEFLWQAGLHSKRKYFYAKPVMLKAVAGLLGIPCDGMPSLKDSEREVCQKAELEVLKKLRCTGLTCLRNYI